MITGKFRCGFFDTSTNLRLGSNINSIYFFKLSRSNNQQSENLEEAYSGSIGLKLLKKQGYQFGDGLGKNRDGIVNPVELSILPANTSLDACMELKEKGYLRTTSDKFSFEKQRHYFKNLILMRNLKKIKKKDTNTNEDGVFGTLNQTIATKSRAEAPTCSYSRLKVIQNETKNVDNLNVDILNIEKEIERLRNDIQHCKKAISLCREMNPGNLKSLNARLNARESELYTNELKLKVLKERKKRKDYDRKVKHF